MADNFPGPLHISGKAQPLLRHDADLFCTRALNVKYKIHRPKVFLYWLVSLANIFEIFKNIKLNKKENIFGNKHTDNNKIKWHVHVIKRYQQRNCFRNSS